MSGQTLAVLLAAAIGIALAVNLENDRRRKLGIADVSFLGQGTIGLNAYPRAVGYSAVNSIAIANVPGPTSTWSLVL